MVRIIMGSAAGRVSDILFIFIGYSKKVASVFTRLLFLWLGSLYWFMGFIVSPLSYGEVHLNLNTITLSVFLIIQLICIA